MRILIADDDRFSLKLIESSLAPGTDDLVTCTSGEEALRLLRTDPAPDIALLDWMMPGLSGIEVCRQARTLPGLPTHFILLTGRNAPEDVAEGLAAGADDYLVKPFEASDLRSRIAVGARIAALRRRLAELESLVQRLRRPAEPELSGS